MATSSFSFNFSGDDIDDASTDDRIMTDTPLSPMLGQIPCAPSITINAPAVEEKVPSHEVPVKKHRVDELLASLPSSIAYTTTLVTSPQRERQALIPRRALFDVRMQIMAEAETTNGEADEVAIPDFARPREPSPARKPDPSTLSNGIHQKKRKKKRVNGTANGHDEEIGLGETDIEQNVYEGGFKSWEGAMDLARLVLERGPRKDLDDLARVEEVIELGCGTALPSLVLFQHALATDLSLYFTLADYNVSVLRLVTVPNLLLVWALQHSPSSFSPAPPCLSPAGSGLPSTSITNASGDLEITPQLLSDFAASLLARSITVTILSGPWSPPLLQQMPLHPGMSLLVLAAETIYSPGSLAAFTKTLLAILKTVKMGKAIVAAKRVYFGVGGSVDEFKSEVGAGGGVAYEVDNSGIEGCERGVSMGVGRCLLEVQMC